tara:strand:- start:309 stop:533 length:225 start_codon:yes stop_codon:yes gene_type:complete
MPINPDSFDTAIGALVRGGTIPVCVEPKPAKDEWSDFELGFMRWRMKEMVRQGRPISDWCSIYDKDGNLSNGRD